MLKIETCEQYGGAVKVIASIEDPIVIRKILDHFEQRANRLNRCRIRPGSRLWHLSWIVLEFNTDA